MRDRVAAVQSALAHRCDGESGHQKFAALVGEASQGDRAYGLIRSRTEDKERECALQRRDIERIIAQELGDLPVAWNSQYIRSETDTCGIGEVVGNLNRL